MKNEDKKKEELINELKELRKQIDKLKKKESEEKYKNLVEESLQGLAIVQGLPPRFVFVNSIIAETLGYSTDELMSLSPEEIVGIIHPEDQAIFFQRYRDRLEGRPVPSRYEVRGIRKDGAVRWAEVLARRIEYQGKPAVQSIFVDITDRKQAEAKLKESEYLYRTLTENSLTGIYMSREGYYLFANEMYCNILGYSWDELKLMDPLNMFVPEFREELLGRFRQRLAGEDVLSDYETKFIRKDGAIRDMHLKATRIMYEGQATVLGNVIDITERKQAEESLRQSEEKYRLVVENANEAIVISQDGVLKFINQKTGITSGYSSEELTSRPFVNIIHPDDQEMVLENYQKRLRGEPVPPAYSFRIVDKSGKTLWMEVNGVPITWEGRPATLNFLSDITMRKQAEEALQKSEKEAKQLAQENAIMAEIGRIISSTFEIEDVYELFAQEVHKLIPFDRIVISLVDLDKGIGVSTYMAGQDILDRRVGIPYPLEGTGIAEMIRTRSTILIQAEDPQEVLDRFPRQLSTLEAGFRSSMNVPLFAKGQIIGALLLRSVQTKAYTNRDVQLAERVGIQIAGAITNTQLYIERKKSEEALQESEERFKTLFKGSAESQILLDRDGMVVDFNSAFLELFALQDGTEVLGHSPADFAPEFQPDGTPSRERAGDLLKTVLEQGSARLEWLHLKHDASRTIINTDLLCTLLTIAGQPMLHVAIRDITERKRTEAQLKESESLYRTTVDNALTGIYMFREGHYIFANEMYCKILGYSWEELKKMDPLDIIALECREQIRDRVKRRLTGEIVLSDYETQIIRKDGRIRDVRIKALRILYDGQPTILGDMADITEPLLIEKGLRESEKRFRSMTEISPFPISIIDTDGRYLFLNQKFIEVFGYTLEDIPNGKDWFKKAYPDPEYRRQAISAWKTDLKKLRDFENRPREFKVLCKDGQLRDILFRLVGIGDGIQFITCEDLTERKQAEKALLESEEKYRSLVAKANDAIFIAQDERIKFPNPVIFLLTGYSQEELVDMPFSNLIHPEDRLMVLDSHYRRLRGEEVPAVSSFRIINKQGEELWAQLNAILITWEGRPAVLCFLRDLTAQKRLEAQYLHAQKMEAVGTLAGGIAHDFNNLLQAVLGYSEILLLKKRGEEPGYQELQEIKRAAQRGSDLTQRLLTFSRRTLSRLRPINLNHEVTQLQKLLQRTIPKMIEIELSLAPDLRTINADPAQIEQALMNLAVNARDAMPGGGKIIIATKNAVLDEEYSKRHLGARPGNYVLLTITDTGYGMDKEILEHLYEPFYTTKVVGKGTGLGLSMVYGIVKSHNGYIFCNSEQGKGTLFEIYLPVISQRLKTEELKEGRLPRGGKETILLIDDDEVIRDLGNQILNQFGYTVLTASDGESGVELYLQESGKIDLVILDLIMPGMGGRRCLEELLKENPKAKVVISSGYSMDDETKEALKFGAKNVISKPYAIREILRVVREVLDN